MRTSVFGRNLISNVSVPNVSLAKIFRKKIKLVSVVKAIDLSSFKLILNWNFLLSCLESFFILFYFCTRASVYLYDMRLGSLLVLKYPIRIFSFPCNNIIFLIT